TLESAGRCEGDPLTTAGSGSTVVRVRRRRPGGLVPGGEAVGRRDEGASIRQLRVGERGLRAQADRGGEGVEVGSGVAAVVQQAELVDALAGDDGGPDLVR